MKTKLVKRHWCDYCNKAGLQARAMAMHEKHCTLNQARACRVCALIAMNRTDEEVEAQRPLADLIAMLPDPAAYNSSFAGCEFNDAHSILADALKAILPAFRLAAAGCPACMMAALRQKKIPVPMVDGFDFKSEMSTIFAERAPQYGDDY